VSETKSKKGFFIPGFDKLWRVVSFSGEGIYGRFYASTDCTSDGGDFYVYGACGSITYNTETEAVDASGFTAGGGLDGSAPVFCEDDGAFRSFDATDYFGGAPLGNFSIVNTETTSTYSKETECVYYDDSGESFRVISGGPLVATVSNEYTTAQLIEYVEGLLTPFPETWAGTPGSFRDLSTNEKSYAARISRYRIQFQPPQIGTGKCYRVEWLERFVPKAGVSLTSADLVTRGVYRPAVTVTGNGTGAQVVAVMAPDGTVDFFRVLNPGQGYTTITITVQAAINGGTTATATGSLVNGQLSAVTKTASGNYLPTGAFTGGGGGTGATIAFTLDETGGIATALLGSVGSGYTDTPNLVITPKVSGSVSARVDLRIGTETEKCAEWDGELPEDPDELPILGDGTNPYFGLPIPEEDGLVTVVNVREFCDCSACP
jgi:hypothetical protein